MRRATLAGADLTAQDQELADRISQLPPQVFKPDTLEFVLSNLAQPEDWIFSEELQSYVRSYDHSSIAERCKVLMKTLNRHLRTFGTVTHSSLDDGRVQVIFSPEAYNIVMLFRQYYKTKIDYSYLAPVDITFTDGTIEKVLVAPILREDISARDGDEDISDRDGDEDISDRMRDAKYVRNTVKQLNGRIHTLPNTEPGKKRQEFSNLFCGVVNTTDEYPNFVGAVVVREFNQEQYVQWCKAREAIGKIRSSDRQKNVEQRVATLQAQSALNFHTLLGAALLPIRHKGGDRDGSVLSRLITMEFQQTDGDPHHFHTKPVEGEYDEACENVKRMLECLRWHSHNPAYPVTAKFRIKNGQPCISMSQHSYQNWQKIREILKRAAKRNYGGGLPFSKLDPTLGGKSINSGIYVHVTTNPKKARERMALLNEQCKELGMKFPFSIMDSIIYAEEKVFKEFDAKRASTKKRKSQLVEKVQQDLNNELVATLAKNGVCCLPLPCTAELVNRTWEKIQKTIHLSMRSVIAAAYSTLAKFQEIEEKADERSKKALKTTARQQFRNSCFSGSANERDFKQTISELINALKKNYGMSLHQIFSNLYIINSSSGNLFDYSIREENGFLSLVCETKGGSCATLYREDSTGTSISVYNLPDNKINRKDSRAIHNSFYKNHFKKIFEAINIDSTIYLARLLFEATTYTCQGKINSHSENPSDIPMDEEGDEDAPLEHEQAEAATFMDQSADEDDAESRSRKRKRNEDDDDDLDNRHQHKKRIRRKIPLQRSEALVAESRLDIYLDAMRNRERMVIGDSCIEAKGPDGRYRKVAQKGAFIVHDGKEETPQVVGKGDVLAIYGGIICSRAEKDERGIPDGLVVNLGNSFAGGGRVIAEDEKNSVALAMRVNHSSNPNTEMKIICGADGLEIGVMLVAKRKLIIPPGRAVELTVNYGNRAAQFVHNIESGGIYTESVDLSTITNIEYKPEGFELKKVTDTIRHTTDKLHGKYGTQKVMEDTFVKLKARIAGAKADKEAKKAREQAEKEAKRAKAQAEKEARMQAGIAAFGHVTSKKANPQQNLQDELASPAVTTSLPPTRPSRDTQGSRLFGVRKEPGSRLATKAQQKRHPTHT